MAGFFIWSFSMAKQKVFNTKLGISVGPEQAAQGKPITAITAGNMPVVTAATHGLESGDVISIKGLNDDRDTVYIIEKIDETSFMLPSEDWSVREAITAGVGLTFTKHAVSILCDVTSLDIDDLQISYDDDITLCSKSKEANEEFGTIGVDANWLPKDLLQRTLKAYRRSQEKFIVFIKPPKTDTIYGWRVMVSQFQRQGEADGKYEASMEFQVDSYEAEIDLVP